MRGRQNQVRVTGFLVAVCEIKNRHVAAYPISSLVAGSQWYKASAELEYTCSFAVWNEAKSSISLYADPFLFSFSLDDAGNKTQLYRKFFTIEEKKSPSPLAVSPDGRIYIASDMTIHNDQNENRLEVTRLPVAPGTSGGGYLIWTESRGLFMRSFDDAYNSVVVQYGDDLEVINTYDFAHRPFHMYISDDKLYVLTHQLWDQLYVYSQEL